MSIYEIFSHLAGTELSSTLAQSDLKDKSQWSTLLNYVSQGVLPEVIDAFTLNPDGDDAFEKGRIIYGLSAIVGMDSMQGWLYQKSSNFPFLNPKRQATSFGLANRFALWKSGRPHHVDNQDPPTELLRSICRTIMSNNYALSVLCIRELRMLTQN